MKNPSKKNLPPGPGLYENGCFLRIALPLHCIDMDFMPFFGKLFDERLGKPLAAAMEGIFFPDNSYLHIPAISITKLSL